MMNEEKVIIEGKFEDEDTSTQEETTLEKRTQSDEPKPNWFKRNWKLIAVGAVTFIGTVALCQSGILPGTGIPLPMLPGTDPMEIEGELVTEEVTEV